LAVAGVLAFHLGWIDGGYLGVDAFFVLSGFLITSLLVAEHEASGRISLRRFWGRRARRLLPAMLAMVAVVMVWAMVTARDQLGAIRGDAVATLLYVANWHEIARSSDYWAIFRVPSPLQHTWSLAIEEQFYLVWPLLVLAVAVLAVRLRRHLAEVLGVAALVITIASYALMAATFDANDVSRAYYGTFTRVGAITLGAALACWARQRPGPRSSTVQRRWDVAAVIALASLGVAWATLAGTTPWLYRGGFALLGLAVAVVIGATMQPRSRLAPIVGWAPLRAMGAISYGLYLWHWVVIAMLTPARTGLSGLTLDAVQLAASFAAALASYWLLEQPIRRRRWLSTPVAAVPAALGAYAAVFGLVLASTFVPAPGLGGLTASLRAAAADQPGTTAAPATGQEPSSVPLSTDPPATVAPLPPARVGVFGDSTAIRTGMGLDAYAKRTGAFDVVVNDGRVGCGTEQGGERRFQGKTFVLANFCGDVFQQWGGAAATAGINVAVIQTGLWEVVERRLPGDKVWRTIGDPLMDARILAELRAVNQFWADRDVAVVWLRAPTPSYQERTPGTMARFNALLEQARVGFPTATSVALDQFFDGLPDAQRQQLRPDGIHFTPESAAAVANAWLGAQVNAAVNQVRRAEVLVSPKPTMAAAPSR
jgi:peptidoglycan/LPS O-acetylase OafA/YrhL